MQILKHLTRFNRQWEPNSLAFIWFAIGIFIGSAVVVGIIATASTQ